MRVAVLGGGVSGLTAAYRLRKAGVEVELLEASSRVGGLLGTELAHGCVVETGPDSILTEKPWAMRLAEELGLGPRIIATRSENRGAYVVHEGRLERVPEGFSLMAPTDAAALARTPLLSPAGKLRAGLELIIPRRPESEGDDESLESFVVRRFGRELFDRLAQPLAGGIYGADPARLSLRATMPRFPALEQRHGSVIRGLRASAAKKDEAASGARYGLFAAFEGGMQTFVDALEGALAGQVKKEHPAHRIARNGEGGYRVEAGGEVGDYDAVIVALPAPHAARVVHDLDRALSEALGAIEYASAATVTFIWPRAAIPHPLDAFGFVVPVIEKRGIIASTWASVKYEGRAPKDKALLRVFIGGHRGQHFVDHTDEELAESARRELAQLLGVSESPLWTRVVRYRRAMPQYHLGHLARVAHIEQLAEQHARFALAGNALHGVGIPDAVKSGEEAAARIVRAIR